MHKSGSEIGLTELIIGLDFQRLLKMSDRFVDCSALEKDVAQVIMRGRGIWVFRYYITETTLGVTVVVALTPGETSEQHQHRDNADGDEGMISCPHSHPQPAHSGRDQSDGGGVSQILEMIRPENSELMQRRRAGHEIRKIEKSQHGKK